MYSIDKKAPQISGINKAAKALQLSSLRSPNAKNKFAFAFGDRKLLATSKFLKVKLVPERRIICREPVL